jgi:hypothetical protein
VLRYLNNSNFIKIKVPEKTGAFITSKIYKNAIITFFFGKKRVL